MTATLPSRSILRRGFLHALAAIALLAVFLLSDSGVSAQTTVTFVSNTGQASNEIQHLNVADVAQAFTTGTRSQGYTVTEVKLRFRNVANGNVVPGVAIYTANGADIGSEVGVFTSPTSISANSTATWTSSGIYLRPNTTYMLLVDSYDSTAVNQLWLTPRDNEDSGGQSGWSIGNESRKRNTDNSGSWVAEPGSSAQIQLRGHNYTYTDPRPLVANTRQPQVGHRSLSAFDVAQQFRTGSYSNGYVLTSLDISFREANNPNNLPAVAIWTESGGNPSAQVAVLTGPSSLAANSLNRWTTPGIYLAPNTNYMVLIDSLGGFSNGVHHTTSNNEDPESQGGWSIFDTSRSRPRASTGAWTISNHEHLIRIDGYGRSTSATNAPTTPRVNTDPASRTSLTVAWRAPFAPVNQSITGYDVRYSTDGSTWTNGPQDVTTTSATITGLTRGTAYQVQVRATSSAGDSPWSASGFGTPGGTASVFAVGNTSKHNEFTDNANLDDHSVFQSFCTGSHEHGYRLTGVELMFLSVELPRDTTVPQVTIYQRRNTEGHPGGQHGSFTRPVRVEAGNNGLNLWTSPGIALSPNLCYVLGVEGDGAGHVVRNQRADDNDFLLDDAGGLQSWYVVDHHVKRPHGTSSYIDVSKNLKLRMFGYAFEPYAAPNFPQGSYAFSFNENTPPGTTVGTPIAADGTGPMTYSLGGPDRASFTIDGGTGQIRIRGGVEYDYESGKTTYSLTVRASDDQNQDTTQVTITLLDVDDRPPGPPWDDDYPVACRPTMELMPNTVTSGRLTSECVSNYHIGWHRLNTAFRQYYFTLQQRTRVMVVVQSDLRGRGSGTQDGRRHSQFDPYLILLQTRIPASNPNVYILPYNIGEYDDIDGSVGNDSAGFIRWLDPGQYVVYATSYSQGVRNVGFKVSYHHEDPNGEPLRYPGRVSEIRYIDYDSILRRTYGEPPDPETSPEHLAMTRNSPLTISWQVDLSVLDGDDYYSVWWAIGNERLDDINDPDRLQRWYAKVRGLDCPDGNCSLQVPNYDPTKHYVVEVRLIDPVHPTEVLRAHYASQPQSDAGQPQQVVAASGLAGLTVETVAGEATQLAVSWDAVPDADTYVVRWKTGSDAFNSGRETTGTTYTIATLVPNTAYTVAVSAIDTDTDPDTELATGEASGRTPVETVETEDMGTVTVAAVADSSDSLDVSWDAVNGATGYRVEWKSGDGSYTTVTRSDDTATSERITGLDAETTYTVRVTALHSGGDGDSAEGTGTTNAAAPPVSFVIYHDPNAGAEAVDRYTQAKTLLSDAGYAYTEVLDATQSQVDGLAGVSGSIMPRFFLGDPTGAGWTSETGVNNGGLRWLRAKLAELGDAPAQEPDEPPANTPATGAPTISGTAQVGQELTADTSGITDADGLANTSFSYQWLADSADISGATASSYTPVAGDVGKAISVRVSFTDDAGNAESVASAATAAVAAADPLPNNAASGAPTISGTAQVGQALTADTSGISDADGLTNASFGYQWLADGADLSGATGSSYTPVVGDVGKAISVRVSFTDDAGHAESVTSAATATVIAADPPAETPDESAEPAVAYVIYHDPNAGAEAVDRYTQAKTLLTDAGLTYTEVTDATQDQVNGLAGVDNSVMPRFFLGDPTGAGWTSEPGVNNGGLRWLRAKVAESGDDQADDPPANSPASGAPSVSGTAKVGETLTAGTSGISDADGLTGASFGYQWLADGADLSGATASSYTPVAGDVGKAISVRVSFTDDAGNAESVTSAATAAVAAADPPPNNPASGAPTISGTAKAGETLTADTSGISDADGLGNASFSYQWLADGADLSGATGSSYTPAAGDVGKAISVRVSFTDDAGHAESLTSAATAAVAAADPPPNNPASGAPSVGGTAKVGETLTVDTSGISDADGLANASFSYQWLADGADLSGATGSSYTPVAGDVGKAISVRVSFTDDAGNAESVTSAATAAVAAADPPPNNPAGGAPTISGTAKVGETLTADTSGISDADGLANASFSYQWLADGADLSGATGSSYTPVAGDVGKAISVRVSFSDDAGNAEAVTSAATAAVAAADPPPAADPPAPDDGPPPVVNLSVDSALPRNEYDRAEITEGDSVTITVTLSKAAPAEGLTVSLLVQDSYDAADFIAQGDQGKKDVVVAGGSATASLTVPTADDDTGEESSYIYVWLREGDDYISGDSDLMEVWVEDND